MIDSRVDDHARLDTTRFFKARTTLYTVEDCGDYRTYTVSSECYMEATPIIDVFTDIYIDLV